MILRVTTSAAIDSLLRLETTSRTCKRVCLGATRVGKLGTDYYTVVPPMFFVSEPKVKGKRVMVKVFYSFAVSKLSGNQKEVIIDPPEAVLGAEDEFNDYLKRLPAVISEKTPVYLNSKLLKLAGSSVAIGPPTPEKPVNEKELQKKAGGVKVFLQSAFGMLFS